MSAAALPDLSRFGSALILKPSSLGDIVHTLPAVRLLKRAFPKLHLRWLSNPEWMPLLEHNTDLDEVIPFPRGRFRGPFSLPALFRWVREFNHSPRQLPEAALDFQGLFRTALLGVLRGAEPVIGLSDARECAPFFYRHVVPVVASTHAVDRYLEVPGAFGVCTDPDQIEFPLPWGDAPAISLPAEFILLHPFARGRGKSLTHEALESLCASLAPRPVVVAGRTHQANPCSGSHVISLVNQTSLAQLVWLTRQARVCISVDSGPMHIAAAVQPSRTLSIHTWSDPRKVGPYNVLAWVWKAGRIAHRCDFSDEEAVNSSTFGPADARRVADFVLQSFF
jgi:heptosyltransferase I